MNFRNLLVALAFVATLGFAACNENPTDNPGTGGPTAPTGLMAATQGPGSVKIMWTAPSLATSYRVSWVNTNDAADKGTLDSLATTFATVTGLQPGREYTFSVSGINTSGVGTAATIKWAAASRYVTDQSNTSVSIKMYEFDSPQGSALILDPANGGPKNARTASGSGTVFGNVNLAMFAKANNTFDIGPAYAFTEFANADIFNHNTFVSRTTFNVPSLNEWYLANPLNTYIDTLTGNTSTFNGLGTSAGGNGQGFIVRTGTGSDMHYARVFIKSVGGSLLQGSAPNRFVELEISYQTSNVPYAKSVAGLKDSPIGVRATVHPR